LPTAEPVLSRLQAEPLRAHGFAEPGAERALEDLVQLAAALCGDRAALVLRDEKGVWYSGGSGFSRAEWAALEPALAAAATGPVGAALAPEGPYVQGHLDLDDARGQSLGRLWALAGQPRAWSGAQRAALALLAGQIQLLVALKRERSEQRGSPRGPSGSSFVPGLVHEMRNFVFGIAGSLDAFRARFGEQPELAKYEVVMRASLDRLTVFVDELGDYGDPGALCWSERDLELLLREAVEYQRPRAKAEGVELRLALEGPLPPVRADERSLVKAFIRLIDLALGQPGHCGPVTVHAALAPGAAQVVGGYVEGARAGLADLDPARLFEPFYFRAAGFSRLALPVARRVFESHGGSLRAELSPGGGLRLCFTLPARRS
jgi:signal transduction histidine kinase